MKFKLYCGLSSLKQMICFAFVLVFADFDAFAAEAKREALKVYGKSYPEFAIFHHDVSIVKQSASPVKITGASVTYVPKAVADTVRSAKGEVSKKDWWNYDNEGLLIQLNSIGESAVAVQYGVHIYNSFNEYLGAFAATHMDTPQDGMTWLYRHSDIFTFKGYGYAFTFVAKVRLKDGSIWTFDAEEVKSQIDPIVIRLKLDEER